MALFDPERDRIVIRVVYDGPGHAGKTTNLGRLCRAFASWRRSDLVSPNTLGERTQYFDWLEVDGGLLRSYPIRAQLLTVPGQRDLTLRRKFVIERADVVVFVADSQAAAIPEARSFYAELCEQLAGFPEEVPIVLQANKQDLPGALPPAKLAKLLTQGLRQPKQVIGSVASDDKGVKQTLAVALKLGSDALRKRLEGKHPKDIVGEVGDATSTYAALERHEAELVHGRVEALVPTLPSASLPSTHLWPPVTGRTLLGQLEHQDLVGVSDPQDHERLVFEGGGWRFATGKARLFDSEDSASQAMWQLTRRKVALASWLPEPCAVAIQPDVQGAGVWLWTVDPVLPTLAEELDSPQPERRQWGLARWAEVVAGALALAERHHLVVELDPASFGVQADEGDRERTRYVGERLDAGDQLDEVVDAVLGIAERFSSAVDEPGLAEFTETLCLGLHHVPIAWERRQALREEFLRASVQSAGAAHVLNAVVMVLGRPARE